MVVAVMSSVPAYLDGMKNWCDNSSDVHKLMRKNYLQPVTSRRQKSIRPLSSIAGGIREKP